MKTKAAVLYEMGAPPPYSETPTRCLKVVLTSQPSDLGNEQALSTQTPAALIIELNLRNTIRGSTVGRPCFSFRVSSGGNQK